MFIYVRQDSLIFYPNLPGRQLTATPDNLGLVFENVTLTTSDNIKLHGWFVPHTREKAVVIFFHGNAGNISHRLQTIQLAHQLGLSIFIFDYRAYGLSEGILSEQGLYLDADAAWNYLRKEKHYTNNQIIIWGRSLGASIAAQLASLHQNKAVILESTFTSVPDMASELYPFLPVRLLSRYQLNVKQSVSKISSPILIIHSRDDQIIPYSHGETLFKAANDPKDFLSIRGTHDDGIFVSREIYTQKLQQFMTSLYETHNH